MVNTVQNIETKTRFRKGMIVPNIEVITDKKAPPRLTAPHSFYRDLVGSMKAGDWFVLEEQDRDRISAGISKYARGRYSLYQNPLQENTYIFTITK